MFVYLTGYSFPSTTKVVALDINKRKSRTIKPKKSPISDKEIEEVLATKELDFTATFR